MSHLAVALTLLAGGLVSLHHDTPEVLSASAPTFGKHRPQPFRAARGVRRLPLASTPDTAKARNPEKRRGLTSPPTPRSADLRPAGAFLTVTAYCATGSRNAAGNWPTVGTAAANAYPLGTRLEVEGHGVVVVEDRSAPGATDVDLYEGSDAGCEARAVAFGRQQLVVREAA